MPFKKVSMVDAVKRLKQKKRQERREAVADSRTEEMPSFVAQKSKIVINMEDSRSRSGSQPSQTTMQKRLASFLKTANERKKKKEIVRLQQKVGGIRNKSQLSYPVMKDNSQMSQTYSNPPSFPQSRATTSNRVRNFRVKRSVGDARLSGGVLGLQVPSGQRLGHPTLFERNEVRLRTVRLVR
ncbi:hypothetical protein L596_015894 [Steinernema carpocapsae]|uniref:Uncharacterized protein n=1 Tax=Steinernema carpocapsae TaxID=34508 RepID=A0A4U5NHJ8_STECR|nr:hypothetical protein L596_015894 [Steinernema carpocapsae]